MLDLNDLQVFDRVAALRSFSNAARDLGTAKANVSRSVARLEGSLGARLFHRSTRNVTLTSAGVALQLRAREIVARADEALDYVGSLAHGPRGSIKVNSGVGFGINIIGEHLSEFLQRYPDIDVTLDLESRTVDLVGDAVDVAVRFGSLKDSTLIAKRLGVLRRRLCAAPSYIERRGVPSSIEALQEHDVIELPGPDGRARAWEFIRANEQVRLTPHPRVIVNEVQTIERLVLSGAGIGILSGYACAPAIADGRLVPVLPEWAPPPLEVHLVFPSMRELAPAVRAFVDFAVEITRSTGMWEGEA